MGAALPLAAQACSLGTGPTKMMPEAKAPVKAAVPSTKKLEHTVVSTREMIAKKGNIQVSGRYTQNRDLEQDYNLLDTVLGTGMNGSVCLAEGKTDGRKYAVKSFKKSGLSWRNRHDLKNEVELYLQLDHPHIAQLHMVFETDDLVHLIMEHMEGGELYDRLATQKRYGEGEAADTVYQVLLAVAYLHAQQIAHRDLKLENFLYAKKDSDLLKLIDFGLAKFWDPSTRMSQACGSIHYVAPEVLFQSYTTQADMWSVGIIAYMLLTGSPAFHGSDSEILRKIKAGKPHYSSKFNGLSASAQSFVRDLLVRIPAKRLTAAQALEHPWIQGRHLAHRATVDTSMLKSLRSYAEASRFRRAALSMMAWSLSTEEQAALREQFLLLDVNKRGSIKLKELKAVLEEHFEVDDEEAERLFSMIDSDNSHEIEYSEFLASCLLGHVDAHEDLLRRTFQRFDRDENGLISSDEMREMLGESFEGADIEELIEAVDTNGDGSICYDEFLAYFEKADGESEERASSSRKRHTQKLATIIDRLLRSEESLEEIPQEGAVVERPRRRRRSSLRLTRLDRRCKSETTVLPVLLGTQSMRSTPPPITLSIQSNPAGKAV